MNPELVKLCDKLDEIIKKYKLLFMKKIDRHDVEKYSAQLLEDFKSIRGFEKFLDKNKAKKLNDVIETLSILSDISYRSEGVDLFAMMFQDCLDFLITIDQQFKRPAKTIEPTEDDKEM